MLKHTKLIGVLLAAGLVSATAFAADSTTTTSTTSTSTTGSTSTTASSTKTFDQTDQCSGGGTRTLTGSWDTSSGAISTKITLTDCVLRNGETHNGTDTLDGTLQVTQTGYTIDVTNQVNTTITRTDGSSLTRTCTTTKNGTYSNNVFDGTIGRNNCSLVGQMHEHEGVVEYLTRDAISDSEDGGADLTARLLPASRDSESVDSQKPETPETHSPDKPESK